MSLCLETRRGTASHTTAHASMRFRCDGTKRTRGATAKRDTRKNARERAEGTQTHTRWHWRLRCGPPSLPSAMHQPPPEPPPEPPPHARSPQRTGPRCSPRRATLAHSPHTQRPSARSPALAHAGPRRAGLLATRWLGPRHGRRPVGRQSAARSAVRSAARSATRSAVGRRRGRWRGGADGGDGVAAAVVVRRWR